MYNVNKEIVKAYLKKHRRKDFYSCVDLMKKGSKYLLPYSIRGIGKSYSISMEEVAFCFLNETKIVLIRRSKKAMKQSNIQSYFATVDIEKMTGGVYTRIFPWAGQLFLTKMEKGEEKRVDIIGYYLSLEEWEERKSNNFLNVSAILFEEAIGTYYLNNEFDILMNTVSTVMREGIGRVWLIGNPLNRICPYFEEFEIEDFVNNSKEGEFYTHTLEYKETTVTITVEHCNNYGKKHAMIAGKARRNISKGEWDTRDFKCGYQEGELLHTIFLSYTIHSFAIQLKSNPQGVLYLFVYPVKKPKDNALLLTNTFNGVNINIRDYLNSDNPIEAQYMKLLRQNTNVIFSDNDTGATFWNAIHSEIEWLHY